MNRTHRLLLAWVIALVTLASGSGAALASTGLEVDPSVVAGSSTATFTSSLVNVICQLTLTASLHRTIAKVRGTLAGFVTEGRAAACRNSVGTSTTVTVTLLPWHLTYQSFGGVLPEISQLLLTMVRASLLFRVGGLGGSTGCLMQGDVGVAAAGVTGSTDITIETLTPLANTSRLVTELEGEFFARCPREGELRGSFTTEPPVNVVLRGAAPRPGRLEAQPEPMVIEREANESAFLVLTSEGGNAVRITGIGAVAEVGLAGAVGERRCFQWMPRTRNCVVVVRAIRRPTRGNITVDYMSAGRAFQLRARFEG